MKTMLKLTALFLAACFIGVIAYACTQQPKFWCNRQWAGFSFSSGGYRSWHLSFRDGFVLLGDKMHPVVFTGGESRLGYYRWPKYGHSDVRKLGLADKQ